MRYFIIICLLFLGACTNPNSARSTLEKNGFTKIQTHGYAWFACSEDDFSHTKFTAQNVNGIQVEGVVCCGLIFKACTVRF